MQRLQDHQVKRALRYIGFFSAHDRSFGYTKEDITARMRCPQEALALPNHDRVPRPLPFGTGEVRLTCHEFNVSAHAKFPSSWRSRATFIATRSAEGWSRSRKT